MQRCAVYFLGSTLLCFLEYARCEAAAVEEPALHIGRRYSPDDDYLVNGITCSVIPGFCHDVYGQILCRRFCEATGVLSTTPSPSQGSSTCKDHIVHDTLRCDLIPEICQDNIGRLVCGATCNDACRNQTGGPAGQHTGVNHGPCSDIVGEGLKCSVIPQICSSRLARILCQQYCGYCGATTTSSTVAPGSCVDRVGNGLTCADLGGVCSSTYVSVICPKFCDQCPGHTTTTQMPAATTTMTTQPAATTEPTVYSPAQDHLVDGLWCAQIPGICQDTFGKLVCRTFCQSPDYYSTVPVRTNATTPPGVCTDHIGNGLECSVLPGICEGVLSATICPLFCAKCPVWYSPNDDHIVNGLWCGEIPGVCRDFLGPLLCPVFCKATANNTTVTLSSALLSSVAPGTCVDHVGKGVTCGMIPGICIEGLSTVLCPHFCGHCDEPRTKPVTTSTTPTTPTTPATPTTTTTPVPTTTPMPTITPVPTTTTPEPTTTTPVPTTTTPLPTTTPVPTTTTPPPTTTTPVPTTTTSEPTTTTPVPTTTTPAPITTPLTTTDAVCMDQTAPGVTCDTLPNVCAENYASILCPKYCGFCGCQNNLSPGVTCEDLMGLLKMTKDQLCADAMGRQACAAFCGCP